MPRTTSDIINQAIQENRGWEGLLYVFSCVFVLLGSTTLIWSLVLKQPITAIAGVIESALFWPAVAAVTRTRKANIMLRMLEVPLGKATTAEDAAMMLQRVFESHFEQPAPGKRKIARAGT
jgi:hypothetical protein